eukprot:4880551-Ditylum_brightwellii.AAC.1
MKKDKEAILVSDTFKKAIGAYFNQMPASKGIKIYGERALTAMVKELKQLNDGAMEEKPVVVPIDAHLLSDDDKLKDLDAVNLIKEKRDKSIKGRTCANGSKQRLYLKEYESVASPTVGLESLILIGAHEGKKFISFDVPGAFLQGEMADNKLVLLKLKGEFVDMMCKINSKFEPHVQYETTRN